MKYSSEITEILSLALAGRIDIATTKLNLLISSIEYEGDAKTAKKLRKALPSKDSVSIAKPPKLYLPADTVETADRFIKGIRMHEILTADGISVPTVLCLHGPDGCGKTALMEYISSALSLPVTEGDRDSYPTDGHLLHIQGPVASARLRELAAKGYITVIESTDKPDIPPDADTIMTIGLALPDAAQKKAFISDISSLNNISNSGMKILLELFKDSSFRDIRQAIMDAKRKAVLDSASVTFALIAQAALPCAGLEEIRHEKEKESIRRKAKLLRQRNPKVFSVQALADIFGKPKATMYYMLSS